MQFWHSALSRNSHCLISQYSHSNNNIHYGSITITIIYLSDDDDRVKNFQEKGTQQAEKFFKKNPENEQCHENNTQYSSSEQKNEGAKQHG